MDGGENVRINAYLEQIQELCNSSIWGSEDRPVRWMYPYDTQMKQIMTICLDNVRTRKVVNSLDWLTDVCIPAEGDGRDLWQATIEEEKLRILF
jgi:hypothetical protein